MELYTIYLELRVAKEIELRTPVNKFRLLINYREY